MLISLQTVSLVMGIWQHENMGLLGSNTEMLHVLFAH